MNRDAKMRHFCCYVKTLTHYGMQGVMLLHPPELASIVLSIRDIFLGTHLKEDILNWLMIAQDN